MTSTEAYNKVISKTPHSILLKSTDGVSFYQDAHQTAKIFFKRIKEIQNPHESDEAKALKELLIKMANDKGIVKTDKRPR